MKISCKVIEDLLPLYYDNICSEESRRLVEEHLAECKSCRKLLEEISDDTITVKDSQDIEPLKSVRSQWIKGRKISVLKGLIAGICICLILFGGGVGLTKWQIVDVSTENMKVTEVCQLADGNIGFHLYIDDSYDLNTVIYTVGEDGIIYITPKRAVIKGKRSAALNQGLYDWDYLAYINEEFANRYDLNGVSDIRPKAVCLGTEKDNILIWQEGMELPEATQEQEYRYTAVDGE